MAKMPEIWGDLKGIYPSLHRAYDGAVCHLSRIIRLYASRLVVVFPSMNKRLEHMSQRLY